MINKLEISSKNEINLNCKLILKYAQIELNTVLNNSDKINSKLVLKMSSHLVLK